MKLSGVEVWIEAWPCTHPMHSVQAEKCQQIHLPGWSQDQRLYQRRKNTFVLKQAVVKNNYCLFSKFD